MRSRTSGATSSAPQSEHPSASAEGHRPRQELREGEKPWAGDGDQTFSSIDLLNLLRAYREQEQRMRTRTRGSRQMGENDLLALRFLVRERAAKRLPRQRDLAQALGLTAAATSVLVDRLSRDGYVRRVEHPEDRRSVAIEVIGDMDREVQSSLSSMQERLISATDALTEAERAGAAKFLQALTESVSEPSTDRG